MDIFAIAVRNSSGAPSFAVSHWVWVEHVSTAMTCVCLSLFGIHAEQGRQIYNVETLFYFLTVVAYAIHATAVCLSPYFNLSVKTLVFSGVTLGIQTTLICLPWTMTLSPTAQIISGVCILDLVLTTFTAIVPCESAPARRVDGETFSQADFPTDAEYSAESISSGERMVLIDDGAAVDADVDTFLVKSTRGKHRRSDMQVVGPAECPICLVDFRPRTRIRILPCSHRLHDKCISAWLETGSSACPLCNASCQ